MPKLTDPLATNWMDRKEKVLWFILRSNVTVCLVVRPAVIVSASFPPMSEEEFFGKNIVENLAAFLGVPPENVKIVNVIRETGRRKRRSASVKVDFEICAFITIIFLRTLGT